MVREIARNVRLGATCVLVAGTRAGGGSFRCRVQDPHNRLHSSESDTEKSNGESRAESDQEGRPQEITDLCTIEGCPCIESGGDDRSGHDHPNDR
jgi:hypothetical protein